MKDKDDLCVDANSLEVCHRLLVVEHMILVMSFNGRGSQLFHYERR